MVVKVHPVLPISPDYYLPKDEMEFYQFCYIDSGGQVRGASTPFCFRKSAEHGFESVSQDDDLLVVTTQVRDDKLAAKWRTKAHVHVAE